jgi:hypothetical protein
MEPLEKAKTAISATRLPKINRANRPFRKPVKRQRQNPYKIKGFCRSRSTSRASIARHNQFCRKWRFCRGTNIYIACGINTSRRPAPSSSLAWRARAWTAQADMKPEPATLNMVAKWGYAHTDPEALSDAEIAAAGLTVARGLTLDALFRNDPQGRAAWKASQR